MFTKTSLGFHDSPDCMLGLGSIRTLVCGQLLRPWISRFKNEDYLCLVASNKQQNLREEKSTGKLRKIIWSQEGVVSSMR